MPENFSKEGLHLKDYLEIIRRRMWIIVTFFVILVTTVTFSTFRQTPIYRATATVLVEKESPKVLSFKDVVTLGERYDYKNYYETQLKIIKSRSIAEKVIAKLRLTNGKGPSPESIDPAGNFLERIIVTPVRNSRLVKISAEDASPEEAARIANTLTEVYVEENLSRKIRASEGASQWIYKELEPLKKKLEESEKALEEYKKEADIISLEKSQDIVVQKLTELSTAFTKAQIERMRAEVMYEKTKEFPHKESPMEAISSVTENRLIQDLKSKYVGLKTKLNRLSQIYKPEHPEMVRLKSQIDEMGKNITIEIEKIIDSLKTEYEVAKSREDALGKALEGQKTEVQELNDKAIQYRILAREAETDKKMYNILLERMKEVTLSTGIGENNIVVLDKAKVPEKPVRPRKKFNILLSVVVGLVMGTGLGFFTEYLDNAVRSVEDIKADIHLPVLASIPNIRAQNEVDKDKIALKEIRSNASEAYRTLRINLRFLSPDKVLKNILITSSAPQEGKTTTLTNLGITLARAGNKVLLVDSDLRRISLHKIFNLQKSPGLTEFLIGESDSIIQETEVDNLSVITGGKNAPNPSELLDSERMKTFVEHLKSKYDVVLYDSPPLVGMSDAVILAGLVDGVIQVVRSGKTPKDLALLGKEILTDAEIKVIGIVLNDVDIHSGNYYHYYRYYHHYYGEKEDKS